MEEKDYDVIGIDLGTTNSCVSVWKNGQIAVVPNEMGRRTTPSVVSFLETETLIGNAACRKMTKNAQNTIFDSKRLIGRKVSDEEIQRDIKSWPFQVVADENDDPVIHIDKSMNGKQNFAPEDISAMILSYLKLQADDFVGHPVTDAVITVPAYFDECQRTKIQDAASRAGLNVLRLLDEPSAAALTYNFESHDQTKFILVYDLGGGTFDVSIVMVQNQLVQAIERDGDSHLGGEDLNRKMMEYLFFQYKKQKGVDISNDPIWRARMRNAVEECKIDLSFSKSSLIEFDNPDFTFSVTRSLFENLNKDVFAKTIEIVEKTLAKANLQKSDISDVVLVGGSTHIPRIQQLLRDYFTDAKINKSVNPDEAVSMGAAILAAVIKSQRMRLLPQTALLSIGIETHGGIVEVMIPRGSQLPACMSYEFVTPMDYQKAISFKVVMGERMLVRDCIELGEIKMDDLELECSGDLVFSISMCLSQEYVLSVSIVESSKSKRNDFELNLNEEDPLSPLNMTTEQIEQLVSEAEQYRVMDEEFVSRHLAINELDCLVEEGFALVERNEEKMTEDWVKQKRELLETVKEWMKQNPDAEIRESYSRQQLIRKNLLESRSSL